MKDIRVIRYNEKVKRLSTIIGAGGLAFVVTAFTRLLDREMDPATVTWIVVGFMLIWIGVQLNEVLQPEDDQ